MYEKYVSRRHDLPCRIFDFWKNFVRRTRSIAFFTVRKTGPVAISTVVRTLFEELDLWQFLRFEELALSHFLLFQYPFSKGPVAIFAS